jgi:Protein of unknown function (DUF3303)
MLFHVTWTTVNASEERNARSLAVFSQWTPPEGAGFKGFYGWAAGNGGVAIIEVDSAATLAQTIAPWTSWFDFAAAPILPIEEASGINGEALAWVDSLG